MSMGLLKCVGSDINEYGVIDVCGGQILMSMGLLMCVGSDINEYGVIDVCGVRY